ncbi:ABC transporter ATP-binding protein [Thermodesulfobacteriota bacterium]
MAEHLLKIENITLSFGGIRALNDVSIDIVPKRLQAIIGPNGAGKTSLINCINGFYRPQQGSVIFAEKDTTKIPPHQIARLGIARTFQNIALFRDMTVLENLMLGRIAVRKLPLTGIFRSGIFWGLASRDELEDRSEVEKIIDLLELAPYRKHVVSLLPYGILKIVELGRALAMNPSLLILDEPSSGMNIDEKLDIVRYIVDAKELWGVTIILIEHDMNVVMDISEWITVLNFGEKIAEGSPKEIQENPEVIAAYLGHKKR